MVPCAKLNTPEDLYISTNPMPTNEYITPESIPPINTSRPNNVNISENAVPILAIYST